MLGLRAAEKAGAEEYASKYERMRSTSRRRRQALLDALKERFDPELPFLWHNTKDIPGQHWASVAKENPATFEYELKEYDKDQRTYQHYVRLHKDLRRQLGGIL